MATYPHAVQKRISRNHGGKRKSTRAVVFHVDAGGASSLFGWFNNPKSSASSHFYVRYDGVVEQYLDTDLIAWTQRDGNATCIGIETQGKGEGSWTPAQLASLVALTRWLCDLYGIGKVDMVTSRASARGIGMHRYGIDPWRASGGQVWGGRGKVCPGDDRVRQFPSVVSGVAGGGLVDNPVVPPPSGGGESEAQRIARLNAGFSREHIRWVQTELAKRGLYKDSVDGVRGPNTQKAIKAFQAASGLVADGYPGPATTAKLKGSTPPPAPKPPSGRIAEDGNFGPASTERLQRVLGTSADGIISGQGEADRKYHVALYSVAYGRGGSDVVRAIQHRLGLVADGYLGPNTIKAIQRHLGLVADGFFGPRTALALQVRLNAGKF